MKIKLNFYFESSKVLLIYISSKCVYNCFISLEIQSGHLKLYEIVEELGPFVTDKDVSRREKGIETLSSILYYVPKDHLNETELHFITSFYCDRLKDHHSIIPTALRGILAIVSVHLFYIQWFYCYIITK